RTRMPCPASWRANDVQPHALLPESLANTTPTGPWPRTAASMDAPWVWNVSLRQPPLVSGQTWIGSGSLSRADGVASLVVVEVVEERLPELLPQPTTARAMRRIERRWTMSR